MSSVSSLPPTHLGARGERRKPQTSAPLVYKGSYTRAFDDGPVVLNHGQMTWTIPDLALPSLNYHTTPTGGGLSSRQI
ncbi:hypothetical protein TNCV_323931 [Trichonephila clavipes]|nr:hypothetical protein TNCV_323931 [Trichonephila clavipes]